MHIHRPRIIRFGRVLLVVAMCASVGLHWAALQTLAWSQMLVSFSRQATISDAVKMTFDGHHPCSLCQVVKKGQSEQKKNDYVHRPAKWDAVVQVRELLPSPRVQAWSYPDEISRVLSWTERPPTPPPRA